jgi:hypothetical protein
MAAFETATSGDFEAIADLNVVAYAEFKMLLHLFIV